MSNATPRRISMRQILIGLILIPLSATPFVAYATLTPEGRLLADKAIVALHPPVLPALTDQQIAAARAHAPQYRDAVMALVYHGIGSADGEGGFVTTPKNFAEHLATLKAAGMNAVTADQVARAFTGGPPLPPNAVMISFDDGRTDAMLFADPLLRQAGMRATMFVITDAAEHHGVYYASWETIQKYARTGRWDIQSHTTSSHREWPVDGGGTLPVLTSLAPRETIEQYRARIHDDLAHAADLIEGKTGTRPLAFAYPFGAHGTERVNDPRIAEILRQEVGARYAIAFSQDDQSTMPLATCDEDALNVRRLEIANWTAVQLLDQMRAAADRTKPAAC